MQFHGSILRCFVPYHYNHYCHIIFGNGFVEIIWKFSNYNMLCKLFIIMKLAFLLPPLIIQLIRLCLIPFFYKFFRLGNDVLRKVFFFFFFWVASSSQTNYQWRLDFCNEDIQMYILEQARLILLYLIVVMTSFPLMG